MTKLLVALAIAPVLIILIFVYARDKVEKEPIGLILLLLGLGALSCLPAMGMELAGSALLGIFLPENSIAFIFLENFLVVALSEELVKYVFTRIGTWKNKNFNFFYDGIIYAATVSLGFALLENILYVVGDENGLQVALMRAILSIPGHAAWGVFMGFFYSEAKYRKNFGRNSESKTYTALALVVPILMHGFYDFALSVDNILMLILLLAFVIVSDIICIRTLLKSSKNDRFIMAMRPESVQPIAANGVPVGNVYGVQGNVPPMQSYPQGNVPPMQSYPQGNVPPMQGYVQGKVPPMPNAGASKVPPVNPNNGNTNY